MCGVDFMTFLLAVHSPLALNLQIDMATLVMTALCLPIFNILLWFSLLASESRAFIVRGDIPIRLNGPAAITITAAVFLWGLIVQSSYATDRLWAWAICGSFVFLLFYLLHRLRQVTQRDSAEVRAPWFPKDYSRLIILQTLVLFLSGSVYSILAMMTK
jgi:hypothetical protein